MKILAVGDSFTYGDELGDRELAWPSVLANKLNGTVINKGQSGGSNDCIIRNCLECLVSDDVDLVVIGWTSPGRSEFVDEKGYYDVWPGYAGKLVIEEDRLWRGDLVNYITQHHSSAAYYEKFLNQVLLMQGFLKSRNQKYVMLNTVQNEHYKRITPEKLAPHYNQVDNTHFIEFGTKGMAEWAYGLKQGPRGHFLEDGHMVVANKIYEHIRHLCWIS
jgi:hypothetical protein